MIVRKRYYRRIFIFFTSLLLIISILLTASYFKVKPMIYRYAQSRAETILLNTANQAVVNILKENDITYDKIVNLSNDAEGRVTSLEIDIVKMNYLKSRISAEVSRLIAASDNYDIFIPLGTLFGNEYVNGMGPRIKFSMQLAATAVVDFESNFTDAGINQTLHQVVIKMQIKGSIIMIGCTEGFETSTSAIAAQTVIVGKTPDAFTNVIENPGSTTADTIFDYGAY